MSERITCYSCHGRGAIPTLGGPMITCRTCKGHVSGEYYYQGCGCTSESMCLWCRWYASYHRTDRKITFVRACACRYERGFINGWCDTIDGNPACSW